MKIVFASSNPGKIQELTALFAEFNITIIPQTELDVSDAAETGLTFVENAILKARHAAEATGQPALADDSGLAVAALGGKPGIYSARFARGSASAENNNKKLLQVMKNIPESERLAAFHCVLVYMTHAKDPTPLICHGIWHGSILTAPQGENGFGYDPLFYVPSQKCSAAQLPLPLKNQLSHRGQALRQLLATLPLKVADAALIQEK
jgi:XTP/dITP diphosphohydrolase